MQLWWTSHQVTQVFAPGTGSQTLSFGGGIDGIGVTSGAPQVYLGDLRIAVGHGEQ